MSRTPGETMQRQFRLNEQTLAELDEIAQILSDQIGGRQTRTDAIRYAARDCVRRMRSEKNRKKSV